MKKKRYFKMNMLSAFMMFMLLLFPVSAWAADDTVGSLTAGQETTFSYTGNVFSENYVFVPKEDGVYIIDAALPKGEYWVEYFIETKNESMSSKRNSITERYEETDYFCLQEVVMKAGTEYKITLNATAVQADSGTGYIRIHAKEDVQKKTLAYNQEEEMAHNTYYSFTAPKTGKYQVAVTTEAGTGTATDWGRVTVWYGTEGQSVSEEFYQNQKRRTPAFEMEKGETVLIELYYNGSDVDIQGTIQVTDYFDNQLQVFASGTQETDRIIYAPEGTATIGVDVSAIHTEGISYQWERLTESGGYDILEETDSTCTVTNLPAYLNCTVIDQYGNHQMVSFSVISLEGEITSGTSVMMDIQEYDELVLYKFTPDQSDYYTITAGDDSSEGISLDIRIYDSAELNHDMNVTNYGTNMNYKGDVYLNEGQPVYILAHSYAAGQAELKVRLSSERGAVKIDEESFPDSVFRNYIRDEKDTDGNGLLSPEEIEAVTFLEVNGYDLEEPISSLKGIEIFENLQSLSCNSNNLTELNLEKNQHLTTLYCLDNQLTSLHLDGNTSLETVVCTGNQKTVQVTEENTFDLTFLPGDFDISRASDWRGGTVDGNILTFTDTRATYFYEIGNGRTEEFALITENYTADPDDTEQEKPDPSVPGEGEPTGPSVPAKPMPSEPTTQSNPENTKPAAQERITSGETVTDSKTKSVYKVSGNSAAGYTVSYVRPSSRNIKSVTIPSTVMVNGVSCKVTSVAANALKGQKKLKKITIGNNITTIGKKAFFGCKNLKKIVIKSKKLKKVEAKAFAKINKNAKIKLPKNKKKAYSKILKKNTGVSKKML